MSRRNTSSRRARRTRSFALPESLESRNLFAAVAWDGGGNGVDWSDPNNWSTNALPGPADDVTIDVAADPIIYLRGGTVANVRSLNSTEALIIEGQTTRLQLAVSSYTSELFFVRGNAELRTAGLFNVYGSRAELVLGWARVTGGGTVLVSNAATLDITTTLTLDGVRLQNNGTAVWRDGDIRLTNADVWNAGTWNVTHPFMSTFNESIGGQVGDTPLVNYGTFTVPAGATLNLLNEGSDVPLENHGTVNVNGTMTMGSGGLHSGRFTVGAGATLTARGQHTFQPASVVNGAGKLVLGGPHGYFMNGTLNVGTLTVDGPVVANFNTPVTGSRFELIGSRAQFGQPASFNSGLVRNGFVAADLAGAADVTFAGGTLEWQSGCMSGGGRTIVAPSALLLITGTGPKTVSRVLEANAPTAWRGGTIDLVNGTINVRNYFSIDTEAGAVAMTNPSGSATFNNFGLIEKSLGAHDAAIGVYVNGPSGDVESLAGRLALTGGGTHRSFSNLPGSTLAIAGNHAFGAGAFDYVRGAFRVEGGTSSFAGNMTAAESVTFAGGTFTLGGVAPRLLYFDGGTGVLNASQSIQGGAMTAGQWLGSGNVKVDSLFTWSGGTIGGTGRFLTATDGVLEITGGAHTLARAMSLDGYTNWIGGDIELLDGGSIRNDGDLGAMNESGTVRLFRSAGNAPFVNNGQFVKFFGGEARVENPFNNAGRVTVPGGAIALAHGGIHSGDFEIAHNARLEMGAGHNLGTGSTFTGQGMFRLSGAIVSVDASQTFDGEVFVAPGSSLTLRGQRTQVREFTVGGIASIAPGGSRVLRVRTLDVQPNAMFDIADNAVVVDHAGASPIDTIRARLSSGYAGGTWSGTGIRSSTVNAQPGMAIGYAEAGDVFASFPATFMGEAVDDTAVVMRQTLKGDANLDLRVNLLDFNRLAGAFGQSGRGWTSGDCNYDGAINLSDFNALAANFGRDIYA